MIEYGAAILDVYTPKETFTGTMFKTEGKIT